jgi:hypothetical protein
VNFTWEQLGECTFRCRLPFLDVTIGVVQGRTGTLLIDAGTTLSEARAIDTDVRALTGGGVSHIVLTHNHFDHVLGSSVFGDAAVYCAPEVAAGNKIGCSRDGSQTADSAGWRTSGRVVWRMTRRGSSRTSIRSRRPSSSRSTTALTARSACWRGS